MTSDEAPVVVVADDDDDARELVAHTLRAAGFTIHECTDGGALIACVKLLLAREEHVSLVLSDINMPEADGLTAAAELRAMQPSLHVVLMSSCAEDALLERAQGVGVRRVLRKPVAGSRLLEVLAEESVSSNW